MISMPIRASSGSIAPDPARSDDCRTGESGTSLVSGSTAANGSVVRPADRVASKPA